MTAFHSTWTKPFLMWHEIPTLENIAIIKPYFDSLRRVHTPRTRLSAGEPWGGTKGMYPESNTLREQHTPSACGGVVDCINIKEIIA
jgi:hypothetical protein